MGTVLVVACVVELVLAGLGVLGVPLLAVAWRWLAIIGALDSLVVIALYWRSWFLLGPLLDLAIIVAAVLGWPRP